MTIEHIDWPGPRPLTFELQSTGEASRRRLIGRDRELSELLDVCQTYAVVEITAASGVGKTSFVAGARPYLERAGATVLKATSWSVALGEYDRLAASSGEPPGAVALYCLAFGQPPCGDAAQLPAMLERLADGKPLVCILDQLEELLRYRRLLGSELLELVGRTATTSGVVHVVIARSEYRNELRPVEVARAPTWHMLLDELADPDVIRRIVVEPVPPDVVVEDELVETLVELWLSARETVARSTISADTADALATDCGLLHLQALLWRFRHWAVAAEQVDRTRLTRKDLDDYARERGLEPVARDAMALMSDALLGYVDDVVSRHQSTRWPFGPRLMLARAARHLSSNGFKVAQSRSSLVLRAMQEELGSARPSPEVCRAFGGTSLDGGRLAKAATFASSVSIEGAGLADEAASSADVTNLMIVCVEEVLEVLADERNANVLRKFQHGEDPIYELVHDGVAPALDRWADAVLSGPMATIGGITARRGDVFSHDLTVETFVDERGEVSPNWGTVSLSRADGREVVVLERLKWHGLGIHRPDPFDPTLAGVRYASLAFRDCEFVGTLFIGVTFEHVTFEACNMRGIALIGCRLRDVTFRRCELPGASLRGCSLERVTFDGEGDAALLDGISIDAVPSGADVEVRGLGPTTGLFVTRAQGGRWSFEDVDVRHFVFEPDAEESVALALADSTLRHATVCGSPATTTVTTAGTVHVWPLTDDNALVPAAVACPAPGAAEAQPEAAS